MRGDFLELLGTGVAIPVASTLLAMGWRRLSKAIWTPDDFMLAFDILVAALALQITFLGFTVQNLASLPDGVSSSPYVEELVWRSGLVVVVGLAAPAGLALSLRGVVLSRPQAFNASVAATVGLFAVFLVNYFLDTIIDYSVIA